jgi:hypothetical protein
MLQKCLNITINLRRSYKSFVFVFLIFSNVTLCQDKNKEVEIRTGNYQNSVILAYDTASNEISGFTTINERGNNRKVIRSCYILFKGKYNGTKKCAVDYYGGSDSEKISTGFINFSGRNITLTTNSSINYCEDFVNLNSGETFSFTSYKPYKFCLSINKTKAYIYSLPLETAKTEMYLIRDNVLCY